MQSPIKYAKSGQVHVAYAVIGKGDVDLVVAPGFISHVEYQQRHPAVAYCVRRLASFSRLVVFDKRGTGLSDPVPSAASLEERVDDLRAVLDAIESKRAVLFGWSEGAAMVMLFAATHPERVSSIILYAAFARLLWAADYPIGVPRAQLDKMSAFVDRWGDGVGLSAWAPSVANDPAFREWWAELQRVSASPGMARSLFELYPQVDVRSILQAIRVPTLVLHRSGDRIINPAHGRYVAARIPASTYVEFDGIDHNFYVGNAEQILGEIQSFVTGTRHSGDEDRALLTLLFIDIVDSTGRAQQLGDQSWHLLQEQFRASVRSHLKQHRGVEVDDAGDGMFATFDGPARAVRCAQAIRATVRQLGLEVRSGLHTGECVCGEGKIGGVAVHIAARIAALANPGEILVSSTVKDLVVGSGIAFGGGSLRALKGIHDEWHVFFVDA